MRTYNRNSRSNRGINISAVIMAIVLFGIVVMLIWSVATGSGSRGDWRTTIIMSIGVTLVDLAFRDVKRWSD